MSVDQHQEERVGVLAERAEPDAAVAGMVVRVLAREAREALAGMADMAAGVFCGARQTVNRVLREIQRPLILTGVPAFKGVTGLPARMVLPEILGPKVCIMRTNTIPRARVAAVVKAVREAVSAGSVARRAAAAVPAAALDKGVLFLIGRRVRMARMEQMAIPRQDWPATASEPRKGIRAVWVVRVLMPASQIPTMGVLS